MASFRIPVACHHRRGVASSPPAPFLEARILHGGTIIGNKSFLIDTGADGTTTTSSALDLRPTDFKKGKATHMNGIGGAWPARKFLNGFRARVIVDEAKGIAYDIPFPSLLFTAPYAEKTGKTDSHGHPKLKEDWGPHARTERNIKAGKVLQNPTGENLLGRDFFIENGLRLVWDPAGDSYIEFEADASDSG